MADTPSVFISYSHVDEPWKDRFVGHLEVSVKQGHFEQWNDKLIGAGEDWYAKITTAMDVASVGVFLISHEFLRSGFILREEVTRLIERREREGLRIVPVYLRKCDWEAVDWLTRMQMRPGGDRPIVRGLDHVIDDEFADIAKEIRLLMKQVEPGQATGRALSTAPDLTRLPRVGEHLFGRERELDLLDGAWADGETNIISLVAWGGVGKSALIKHWLGRMARQDFRGATRVYGWSFYRQGMREEEASADEFFAEALRWFGEPKPEGFQQTERARRLAELIQKERALLVLDGLEPLQHSSRTGPEGQIKDQTLAELVRLLAWQNPGLIAITTRMIVDDIRDLRGTTAPVIELGHLSAQAGAQLLTALGVKGEQEELEAASREFGGHSLALSLLGTYLCGILGGDVRRRGEVSLLEEDAEHGGHARRIMRSYEKQFAGSPELAVLQLIGMFDRPAKRGLIDLLRRLPVIEGLNDQLVDQKERDWQRTLARLRHAKLLSEETPDEIDAHPLVREHFGERLKTGKPEAWRAGHGRLYEHLRDTAESLPDTLAEMAPLFQAMHHGCQAGRYQEVLDEVYWARINRGDEFYNTKKLGAFGADLAAIAGLFDPPWERPVAMLTEVHQAFILNGAAFDLRALGRLREAVAPMRASLNACVWMQDWKGAAIRANNISELHLALGDVAEAVAMGEANVEYADRSEDVPRRIGSRTTWADALHQAGKAARAQALFDKAEALQAGHQPPYPPRLYSLGGYHYCDLLLAEGRAAEVRERAAYALSIVLRGSRILLDIALNHLSLGRAALALGEHGEAGVLLDQAVDGLRQAGTMDHLPRGLLARAAFFRETGEFKRASGDLDEAMQIAGRSEMWLFQCDAHLEYARLALAESAPEKAREHVVEARRLVEETGYGRRRPEVEELEAEVGQLG
jgi:tetratricopeptide (TPR) repeat protein